MGGNQQPAAVHNEPQPQGHGQQRHGMTRQIQGLGAPTIQQGMYNVKSEEPGQQGLAFCPPLQCCSIPLLGPKALLFSSAYPTDIVRADS